MAEQGLNRHNPRKASLTNVARLALRSGETRLAVLRRCATGEACTEERRGRLKQGMFRRADTRHALRTGTVSIVADGQVMECWYAQWCVAGYYR